MSSETDFRFANAAATTDGTSYVAVQVYASSHPSGPVDVLGYATFVVDRFDDESAQVQAVDALAVEVSSAPRFDGSWDVAAIEAARACSRENAAN